MFGKIMLGFLMTTAAFSGYIMQNGFVHISVDEAGEHGTHLHLVVPAELGTLVAHFAPTEKFAEHRRELRALLPSLKLCAQELVKLPDSVLVEVRDAHEHVLISKAGDGISIEEESAKEHVKLWIPLHAIYDTAAVLKSRMGTRAE
jgi:hypothetical protein